MTRSLDDADVDALLARVLDAYARDDADEALRLLEAAAPGDGVSARVLLMLGSEYAQIGRFEEAVVCLRRAATASPQWSLPGFRLALLLLCLDRREEALGVLLPLAESASPPSLGGYARALACMLTGNLAEAESLFVEGLANETDPLLAAEMKEILVRLRLVDGGAAAQVPATGTEADAEARFHPLFSGYTSHVLH